MKNFIVTASEVLKFWGYIIRKGDLENLIITGLEEAEESE